MFRARQEPAVLAVRRIVGKPTAPAPEHLVDLTDLPTAHRVGSVKQKAVSLVEHQESVGIACFGEGVGDVSFGPTHERVQEVRGAFLQQLETNAFGEVTHPGALARTGGPDNRNDRARSVPGRDRRSKRSTTLQFAFTGIGS